MDYITPSASPSSRHGETLPAAHRNPSGRRSGKQEATASRAPAKEIRVDAAGAAAALSELVGISPLEQQITGAARFFLRVPHVSFTRLTIGFGTSSVRTWRRPMAGQKAAACILWTSRTLWLAATWLNWFDSELVHLPNQLPSSLLFFFFCNTLMGFLSAGLEISPQRIWESIHLGCEVYHLDAAE